MMSRQEHHPLSRAMRGKVGFLDEAVSELIHVAILSCISSMQLDPCREANVFQVGIHAACVEFHQLHLLSRRSASVTNDHDMKFAAYFAEGQRFVRCNHRYLCQ